MLKCVVLGLFGPQCNRFCLVTFLQLLFYQLVGSLPYYYLSGYPGGGGWGGSKLVIIGRFWSMRSTRESEALIDLHDLIVRARDSINCKTAKLYLRAGEKCRPDRWNRFLLHRAHEPSRRSRSLYNEHCYASGEHSHSGYGHDNPCEPGTWLPLHQFLVGGDDEDRDQKEGCQQSVNDRGPI